MAEHTERAKALISTRLEEIEAEAADLERALRALAPGRDGSRRPPRRRRAAASKRRQASKGAGAAAASRPRKRAPRGVRREELLAAIKARPGSGAAELAEVIGIRRTQVQGLIAKARSERLIARDGDGYKLRAG